MNDRELDELYHRASATDRARPSQPVRQAILSQAARSARRPATQRRARLLEALRTSPWSRWQIAAPVAAALVVTVILVPVRRLPAPPAAPALNSAPSGGQLGGQVPQAGAHAASSPKAPSPSHPPPTLALEPQAFPREAASAPPLVAAAPSPQALAAPPQRSRAARAVGAPAAAPSSAAAQENLASETVVSGARMKRQDFNAPSPITSIGSASGQADVQEARHPSATLESTRQIQRAAAEGNTERLGALLSEHPALVDSTDAQGHTPLMIAVLQRQRAAVELLLARGADPYAADNGGRTPLQLAIEGSDPGIRAALMSATAKTGHSGTR
jgi:hypothetical protein